MERKLLSRLAAEFVVIVTGVLVALAVDQWSEEQNDQALGKFYLASLELDLVADSQALDGDVSRAREAVTYSSWLDAALAAGDETPHPDSLATALLVLMAALVDPPYSTGTIGDLASSGRANLIEDGELRASLLEYRDYTQSSRAWLAERRENAGMGDTPAAVLMTPFFAWARSPAENVFTEADARETLRVLRADATARPWVRQKEVSFRSTELLLGEILSRRTVPLLDQVRAGRR